MKSLLAIFIFSVAVCQVFDMYVTAGDPKRKPKIHVTVYYETLCLNNLYLYTAMDLAVHTPIIKNLVEFELIPFGHANYTEKPWNITCEHGPKECDGNAMNACFMANNSDQVKQVSFVNCCMHDPSPSDAGERCAKKLNYDFGPTTKCLNSEQRIQLQIKNGKKTLAAVKPNATLPAVFFNGMFNEKDSKDALVDLGTVIYRKLKAEGVNLEI